MNSTLDEGENFLRTPDADGDQEELEEQSTSNLDADVPEVAPSSPRDDDEKLLSLPRGRDVSQEEDHTQENGGELTPVDSNGMDGVVSPRRGENGWNNEDTTSIPDDTPSVQGSILSSPRSETASLRSPVRRGSPSITHRPFDARFQSRLSSAQFSPLRPGSPAFLATHSRHSSSASLGLQTPPEPDESTNPWDVIRWSRFKKITGQAFSEIGRRNFGSPTCLAVADQLVIGTSKGVVLIFDQQQNHKAIIGSGTLAAESGSVTALAISADHTTIAVGHATGHIFTWEVARPARPFLHIQPIDNAQPQARRGDGHITASAVLHVGFLGYRHTALVSADDKGMAFSHLATRGMGAVSRVVRTTRILGRYPELVTRSTRPLKKSSVLAFSPLPLGNVEQRTDGLGLVAMLTPYLLVIVSTTPVAQTQHKAARPREVAAHSAMTAALAWFPAIKLKSQASEASTTKLVYAWSNILTVLEVHEAPAGDEPEKDKPPELQFLARSRYQADEAIVAVQWLNKSVMAVLTITQQLLIIEDLTMHVTEAFDLLKKNVYHADLYSQQLRAIIEQLDEEDSSLHGVVADAFHMSFRAYKGRLFLLGFNDLWTGVLTNWADRLLALINVGDFIGAIRLATKYYVGEGERATIGLPEDDAVRFGLVRDKLFDMMTASLRFAFGKNQQAGTEPIEKPQMVELADACIQACLTVGDRDFLFDEVFGWYEDDGQGPLFVDVLEPYIVDRQIVSVPPPALKTLIHRFATTHPPSTLEEIICMLDTSTMDIDQVTNLCKRYHLYDAYIYVWTMALRDFETPLTLLLDFADDTAEHNHPGVAVDDRYAAAQKVFPYISFILTSRVYPTGVAMDADESTLAKGQIYDYFFSGVSVSKEDATTNTRISFGALSRILHFDAPSFLAALNEAFEDGFLNLGDDEQPKGSTTRTYTRQYIVRILLEIMSSGFGAEDTIYLDMFIARNLAKYPQHIILSGTILQEIFVRLCDYPEDGMREDAQLSIEYLLSVFQPPSILDLVPMLQAARFYRVLKAVYRQEGQYSQMIDTFFLDDEDQDGVFAAIVEYLRPGFLSDRQRSDVKKTVETHASELVGIDPPRAAATVDEVAPELHHAFLGTLQDDAYGQYEYLRTLLDAETDRPKHDYDPDIFERYIRLLCRFDPSHVREYVEEVKEGDIRLAQVLPTIEDSGIVDAVVILQVRQGHVQEAMDRLTRHLALLGSTLKGLDSSGGDGGDDDASIIHSGSDVLESISKYTRVGVWLCQEQMKNAPRSPAVSKSLGRSASATRALSFEEGLWLDLILSVVSIARENSIATPHSGIPDETTTTLRTVIQHVFTALLSSTMSTRQGSAKADGRDTVFLRILRAFLTRAAEASPSLAELRGVLASVFSAYAYEESLLALSNAMLDKDVFGRLDEVAGLRRQGWRPRGQVCEVCRRRVWGPGMGTSVWEDWQKKEEDRRRRRLSPRGGDPSEDDNDDESGARGKGKAAVNVGVSPHEPEDETSPGAAGGSPESRGPIVVFSCRHLYHQKCLGQKSLQEASARLVCPACI